MMKPDFPTGGVLARDGELLQAKLIREGHAKVAYIFSGEYLYLDYLRSVEKSVTQSEESAS